MISMSYPHRNRQNRTFYECIKVEATPEAPDLFLIGISGDLRLCCGKPENGDFETSELFNNIGNRQVVAVAGLYIGGFINSRSLYLF